MRVWLFPWLSYVTIGAMFAVLVAMASTPELASQFYFSLLTLAVVVGSYYVFRKPRAVEPAIDEGPVARTPGPRHCARRGSAAVAPVTVLVQLCAALSHATSTLRWFTWPSGSVRVTSRV